MILLRDISLKRMLELTAMLLPNPQMTLTLSNDDFILYYHLQRPQCRDSIGKIDNKFFEGSVAAIGVWIRNGHTRNGRDTRSARIGSTCLVVAQSAVAIVILINHASHAFLAVVSILLGTVIPDGILVLDDNLEDIG